MMRLALLALLLLLAACAPPAPKQASVDEAPVILREAPATSPADLCKPNDDGIGGTGCKEQ